MEAIVTTECLSRTEGPLAASGKVKVTIQQCQLCIFENALQLGICGNRRDWSVVFLLLLLARLDCVTNFLERTTSRVPAVLKVKADQQDIPYGPMFNL